MSPLPTFVCLTLAVGLLYPKDNSFPPPTKASHHVVSPALQTLLDSAQLSGVILVYDPQTDTYYSNNFDAAEQSHLPASTYKIPHSIIALETGVVRDDSTLFPWNGEERAMERWEQDLLFRDAFQVSCMPCYQEVARQVEAERMNAYLRKLNYGAMVVDTSNVDQFWLEGDSRISPAQQVDFLRRFYERQLPISARTEAIVKRMMVVEDRADYRLSGKTGLSNGEGAYNGWFVGYVETRSGVYFLATNVAPNEALSTDLFLASRMGVTTQALETLKIIP